MSETAATATTAAMTGTEDNSIRNVNVGFIGLGAMGLPMALNVYKRMESSNCNKKMYVYDVNEEAVETMIMEASKISSLSLEDNSTTTVQKASSPKEIGLACNVIISMVPNDAVLKHVVTDESTGLLQGIKMAKEEAQQNQESSSIPTIHIGCSTVHPDTSRTMATLHETIGSDDYKVGYIGAPVFARADGVAQRAATLVVGGCPQHIQQVMPILDAMALGIYTFDTKNNDAGAGNVVKLCGNFMIASAIESCAEACTLAEQNGIDRTDMMNMMTSTIFDCLIYKGYGMRTASKQHIPGQPMVGPGFQLDLGLKDISLVKDVGQNVNVPMPLASLLQDKLLSSRAKGRGKMDWSAMALISSEDAGIDVSPWLPGGGQVAESGDSIAPM